MLWFSVKNSPVQNANHFYLLTHTVMQHNKLVRDLLPLQLEAEGKKCIYRPVQGHEMHKHLLQVFFESVKGFLNAGNLDEKTDALADLHEIVDHLMEYYAISQKDVLLIKEQKRQLLGGFDQKILLEEELLFS